MALKDADKKNFETIRSAISAKKCCIVESRCALTGEYRALICAVNTGDGTELLLVPLAQMITGDPFEQYTDPCVDELPEAIGEPNGQIN